MADKEYDNNRRMVLFPEGDKEGNEKRPDFTGKITFKAKTLAEFAEAAEAAGGEIDLRLAAWKREGRKGIFLSGEVSAPQERTAAASNSDIPF